MKMKRRGYVRIQGWVRACFGNRYIRRTHLIEPGLTKETKPKIIRLALELQSLRLVQLRPNRPTA